MKKVFCPFKKSSAAANRYRGSSLITVVVVASLLVSLLGLAFTQMMQTMFSGISSGNIAIQAQQYAASKAEIIKLTNYDDLTNQSLKDVPDTQFQDEVILSEETVDNDNVKQRTATVNVYKAGDSIARVSVKVPRSNRGEESSGVPIGTIIAWGSSVMPKDGGTWLICNGQSTAAYPKLREIVGNNVPNYQGVFLRGYGSQTSTHYGTVTHSSDALGELQGDAIRNIYGLFRSRSNAFYGKGPSNNLGWNSTSGVFKAIETGLRSEGNADSNGTEYIAEFNTSNVVPTASENRPVNKAVYWLIKAA